MKYFSWLFTERVANGNKGEETDKFRLDLAMMVGAFCLIGSIVLAIAVYELGNISYETRMKMGAEGYQKYVAECQTLEEDVQALSNGWDMGRLQAKYPDLSVSFSSKDGYSVVEMQKGEISLMYSYREDAKKPLERQSNLLSSEEYEEMIVKKLHSFRVELWMCSILLLGGILVVISCIISIIGYFIQKRRQAIQKSLRLANQWGKE